MFSSITLLDFKREGDEISYILETNERPATEHRFNMNDTCAPAYMEMLQGLVAKNMCEPGLLV